MCFLLASKHPRRLADRVECFGNGLGSGCVRFTLLRDFCKEALSFK